jgi:hypothetical protein
MPPTATPLPSQRLTLSELRQSILNLPVFKPRWKPWSPGQVIAATALFGLFAGFLVVATMRVTKRWTASTAVAATASVATAGPIVTPADQPQADAALVRDRRSPLSGGLLLVPPSFHSADGKYDLIIHLHGNTDLVEESFTLAALNAVVVIMNLGTGSGPYEDKFANPMVLPEMLDRVNTTMEKRGLLHPSLRRVALSGWSAGYGGVLKVIEQPSLASRIDAVLLLDGIHCGYKPHSKELWLDRMAGFTRFAQEAVTGKKLFSITHTHIIPIGNYAGTYETTDALLAAVGVTREPGGEAPVMPTLKSVDGVIAKKLLRNLEPETTARRGGLIVRAYSGDQPEDHMAHLYFMAVTVLPDLIAWWK